MVFIPEIQIYSLNYLKATLLKTGLQKRILQALIGLSLSLSKLSKFMMGSPKSEVARDGDETQHEVTITRSFKMSKYEVTQAQWSAVMGKNPSLF